MNNSKQKQRRKNEQNIKKTKHAISRINPLKKKKQKEEVSIEVVDILRDIGNFDLLSDDDDESTMDDDIMQKNANNPWFNEDIASVVKLCRKYRRKHHKSKTKKQELKKICKELEKKKRKLIRSAKQKWTFGQKNESVNVNEIVIPSTPPPPPMDVIDEPSLLLPLPLTPTAIDMD